MKKEIVGDCELYHGDCFDVLPSIHDVDLVLVDLPYGATQNKQDRPLSMGDMWDSVHRVIKDTTPMLFFAQGLFYVDLVNSNRKEFRYDLVWDKVLTSGFLNANRMPLRRHEQIAVFYAKLGCYNPQFQEGKPLHGRGNSYMDKDAKNQNYGAFSHVSDTRKGSTSKYPTSILKFAKPHPSVSQHRTEKSIECLEYLIKTYSNEGDLVLDFTAGSMTTAIGCINTGRKCICIEKDEDIFNNGFERVKRHYETIRHQ